MAYVFRQGDLPKLDLQIDRGTDFAAWRAQWEAYATLSGLDKEAPDKQVKALTLCFSRETLTVVDNLGLSEDQRSKATKIIDAIQRYVEGHVNESVERRNFRRRVQHPGESFDDFLVSLRELAKTCKFSDNECIEKNIRDQIIEGIHDGDTVQNLLQEKDLSLSKAITMCQAQEAAKKNRAEMARYTLEGIQALDSSRYDRGGSSDPPLCPGCGARQHSGGRRQCPAHRQECFICQKRGHFAKVCRGRQEHQPQPVRSSRERGAPRVRTFNIRVAAILCPAPVGCRPHCLTQWVSHSCSPPRFRSRYLSCGY